MDKRGWTGDGFRVWLDRAMRIEEDVDWSDHMIEYKQFKQRLKFFAKRRSQIRRMLRESPDNRISDQELTEVLGPANFPPLHVTLSPKRSLSSTGRPTLADAVQVDPGNYISMVEIEMSGSSDAESNSSIKSPEKRRRAKRNVMRRLSNAERNEVAIFLTYELDKVFMFYLAQWQRLSQRLDLRKQTGQFIGSVDTDLGDEILELMAYCVTNIVTAHQILIRYDAFARAFEGTPMQAYYIKKVTRYPTSFRKIMHHEELNAVADSYMDGRLDRPLVSNFAAQRFMFQDILSLACSQSSQTVAMTGRDALTDSFVYRLHNWFLIGLFDDQLGLEPAYLTSRGKSLTHEMEQLASWRKKRQDVFRPMRVEKKLTGLQVYNLTLNLLSAFLYCMNYYIVEPSSTMYVNRLGAHDAMSGTLIGMLPLAAFMSSIPYSMWTNLSFRQPFIMSCCMLILGNLTYSLADQAGSVWVALAGRFISGLGAPKCIIRRYIADTTPVSLRTSVNAGFGMVVAAGSAMGPAMAVVLSRVESASFDVPVLGTICLDGLTLPGYFMACLWITFAAIVLMTFEEPHREGLEEQKKMEQEVGLPGSPSTMSSDNTSRSRTPLQDEPPSECLTGASGGGGGGEDDLNTIFSGESHDYSSQAHEFVPSKHKAMKDVVTDARKFVDMITLPVRLCLGLLFAKVFTIEALVSATSALTKNRYHWQVQQVGTLGCVNGIMVIPFSILVGRLSMSYQDHILMRWLVGMGCFGLFLLIDLSDLVAAPTRDYNVGHVLAVSPGRYIAGYFLSYLSIQAFEGVIGSTLSKVIPTALASGTFNSGLLATLVDTFGRACGDIFISFVGFISLRQLMNLLFIPGFVIMMTALVVIERYRDLLSV